MQENTAKKPDKKATKTSNAGFYRLCAALVILGAALIARAIYPEQTKEFLSRAVSGGVDYTEFFENVGDNFRSFVMGVPHPDEDDQPIEVGTERIDLPEPESVDDPDLESEPDSFTPPPLWADADFLVSSVVHEDDTLPLPFGFSQPALVDYDFHELPFETVLPLEGRMSSQFGYRIHPILGEWRFHHGIDIAAPSGTPIRAFADGTVAAVGYSNTFGNYLLIDHGYDFLTLYAHCLSVTVREGQSVEAGQEVAKVGSTGLSTGPHLHFELHRNGKFLDPAIHKDLAPLGTGL